MPKNIKNMNVAYVKQFISFSDLSEAKIFVVDDHEAVEFEKENW